MLKCLRTVERRLVFILVLFLLASSLLVACDRPALTEKQVLELTHEYLTTTARDLQGLQGWARSLAVEQKIVDAVLDASDPTDWGESVQLDFIGKGPISTGVNALKKLVTYKGEEEWHVVLGDWEWILNEESGVVRPLSDGAQALLQDISLDTYQNSKYGYSVDYPPDWIVLEKASNALVICKPTLTADFRILVFDEFAALLQEKEQESILNSWVVWRVASLQDDLEGFQLGESNPGFPVFQVHYTYLADGANWERLHYFVLEQETVYEVMSCAVLFGSPVQTDYGPLTSDMYDAYKSFRLPSSP